MKFILPLVMLVVAAVTNAAVVSPKATSRSNLNVGYIYPGDRLLNRSSVYRQPIANTVQYQDVVYRGNKTTRISAIQVYEIGYTQYATPWIIYGGIGANNVTIRIQSYRGYGYYYYVDIWGH